MDIVILDLEWNAAYSRRIKGYINEIIQFGAVKCGPDLGVKSRFSCFVKPQVGKHVNALVTDLTSITDENLTDGLTFMQAVSRFKKWAGDCVILTWGTSDILTLIENCRYFSGDETCPSSPGTATCSATPRNAWAWAPRSRWASPKRRSCWSWTSPAWTTTGPWTTA